MALDRGLRLHLLAPRPGLRVCCDRHRVQQVIGNLLGNALRVTPSGGEVTLSAVADGGQVCFRGADTGPGVPAEQRDRLFVRYVRGQGAQGKGTGLGLFISRGIVAAHGGRIWVEDRQGGGAVFAFSLPLTVPPSATP